MKYHNLLITKTVNEDMIPLCQGIIKMCLKFLIIGLLCLGATLLCEGFLEILFVIGATGCLGVAAIGLTVFIPSLAFFKLQLMHVKRKLKR